MPSITDIVDIKGRLNYKQLKDFISKLSIGEFTDQATYPFLVGKELYDGELMSRPSSSPATSTMRFNAVDLRRQLASKQDVALPSSHSKSVSDTSRAGLPRSWEEWPKPFS